MMQEGGLDCVTGLGKYQGRLIILLDIDKLLAAPKLGDETSSDKRAEKSIAKPATAGTTTGANTRTASAGK
jgi:hypothetical protein